MDDRTVALTQLKQNAPKFFSQFIVKKTRILNTKIADLRSQYKIADSPEEKKKIEAEGKQLKTDLQFYQSV
jgi:hypothetical protein